MTMVNDAINALRAIMADHCRRLNHAQFAISQLPHINRTMWLNWPLTSRESQYPDYALLSCRASRSQIHAHCCRFCSTSAQRTLICGACAQFDGGVKCGEGKSGANSHEQPRKVLAMKLERRRLKGHRSPLKCKVLLFGQFFIPSAHLSHNAGQRQRPELKPLKHSNAAFEQVDFY